MSSLIRYTIEKNVSNQELDSQCGVTPANSQRYMIVKKKSTPIINIEINYDKLGYAESGKCEIILWPKIFLYHYTGRYDVQVCPRLLCKLDEIYGVD